LLPIAATRSRNHPHASRAVVGRGFLAVANNGAGTAVNSGSDESDSRKNSSTSCSGKSFS